MAVTPSTMLPLGTEAPDFSLPDTEGKMISPGDFKEAPALLVMFLSNHCPYVKHVLDGLVALVREFQKRDPAVVAINCNDVAAYPEDSPEKMVEVAAQHGFTFPYLFDETQEVAKAYRAACTPDFYVFDQQHKLVYRGQMDDSRPGNEYTVCGADLRVAIDAVLEGRPVPPEQRPSMGCNIKWKPGNEPDYFK